MAVCIIFHCAAFDYLDGSIADMVLSNVAFASGCIVVASVDGPNNLFVDKLRMFIVLITNSCFNNYKAFGRPSYESDDSF